MKLRDMGFKNIVSISHYDKEKKVEMDWPYHGEREGEHNYLEWLWSGTLMQGPGGKKEEDQNGRGDIQRQRIWRTSGGRGLRREEDEIIAQSMLVLDCAVISYIDPSWIIDVDPSWNINADSYCRMASFTSTVTRV